MSRMDVQLKQQRLSLWWLLPAAGITLLLLLAFSRSSGSSSVHAADLRTAPLVLGPLLQHVRAVGTFEAVVQRRISSRASGEVREVLVEPGALVGQGELLMILANSDLEGELVSASTHLAIAEAELAAARLQASNQLLDIESSISDKVAQLRVAEAHLDAAEALRRSGVVSGIQLITARAEKERLEQGIGFETERLRSFRQLAASNVGVQEAKVNEARRIAELREAQVESLLVTSTIDGMVQSVAVSAGEVVVEGSELALVSRPSPLRVRLQIPQGQAQMISINDPVLVDVRGTRVEGRVASIAPVVQDGTVDAIVNIDAELPPAARVALSVEAEIIVELRSSTLWAPRPDYIATRATSTDVFVLSADQSRIERVPVQLGLITRDAIEVLSGLRAGDNLIVTGLGQFTDAEHVRVIE